MTRKQLLNLPPYAFKGLAEITKSYKLTESYFTGISYFENLVTDSEIYSKNPIHSFVANKLLETFLWDGSKTTTVSEMIDNKSYTITFDTNIRQDAVQDNSGKTIYDVLTENARNELLTEVGRMSNSEKQDILLNAFEDYYYMHLHWFDDIYENFPNQIQKQIDKFPEAADYFNEVVSDLNQDKAELYDNNLGQFTEFQFKDDINSLSVLSCRSVNSNLLQHYLYAQIPGYINENLLVDFCTLFSYASRVLDNFTSYFYSIHDLLSNWGIAICACQRAIVFSNPVDFANRILDS